MSLADNYKEVLNEELSGQLKALMEVMNSFADDVPIIKQKVISLEEKFENVEMRAEILEDAVALHSRKITDIQKLLPA